MSKPPLSSKNYHQAPSRGLSDGTSPLGGLLRKIESVLAAEDSSVKGLAKAAGLDPKRDFRGIYLNGLPLADQDISGFDFSGSDLRNTGVERAKRDASTLFENTIFDGPSLDRRVISFNRRLRDIPFSELESELNKAIQAGQRQFDVISFTTAIRRSPRIGRAEHWYEEMKRAGVAPNDVTFNTSSARGCT
jgi:hypothetical protein